MGLFRDLQLYADEHAGDTHLGMGMLIYIIIGGITWVVGSCTSYIVARYILTKIGI